MVVDGYIFYFYTHHNLYLVLSLDQLNDLFIALFWFYFSVLYRICSLNAYVMVMVGLDTINAIKCRDQSEPREAGVGNYLQPDI